MAGGGGGGGGEAGGLAGAWDGREKAVSGLTPRLQPRCWACVVVTPFPRTRDVGQGPGLGERGWLWLRAL